MPTNKLFCPSCKTVLVLAKPVPAGSAVRCSKCRQVLTVPAGATEIKAVKAPPPPRPAPAPKPPAEEAARSVESSPKMSTTAKVLLAAGAGVFLLVGVVLGILGKTAYDHFTKGKETAQVANPAAVPPTTAPAKPEPPPAPSNDPVEKPALNSPPTSDKPSATATPAAVVDSKPPAPPTPTTEDKPPPATSVQAHVARIKITNPRFTKPAVLTARSKYEPEANRWVYSLRTVRSTNGVMYIDLLPVGAPTTLDGYARKLLEKDFQEPGRQFTQITDKGTLPDGFFVEGVVKDQANPKPEFGFVAVRKVNGAFLRCRNGKVADRPVADDEIRQAMLDVLKLATIRTTPLISLPPPSGSVLLRDNVTLIVSQAEKAQLVYFDTMADREVKRVEVDFQPGELVVQGDTLFAAAKGSAQVYALDAATGKLKKEHNLGGEAIVHLACHPDKGLLYASTNHFGVVSLDPASDTVTKTKAMGQFLAVSPDGKFLYTGVQPPDRDEIEVIFRRDGSIRIFSDMWGPRALLMKYAVNGPDLKFVCGQNNAAINGRWMHLTPDGKRLFMVGGGGWRPPKEGGTGGAYITAVFSTDKLETMLQPIPFSGLNTIFHPVLNLGVANSYGLYLTLFNGKSLVKRTDIPLSPNREDRPLLLTFGGKGRKLILWNGDNIQNEQGLHFLPLPLKPEEEAALEKAYGR